MKPIGIDEHVTSILMLAGQRGLKRDVSIGIEAIGSSRTGSADVLAALFETHSNIAQQFASGLGTDVNTLKTKLDQVGETKEREPESTPSDLEIRKIAGHRAGFSGPIREARRDSNRLAQEQQANQVNLEMFTKSLLSRDCDARQVLLSFTDSKQLDGFLENLHFEPTKKVDLFQSMMQSSRQVMDSMWPKLMEEQKEMMRKRNDGEDRILKFKEEQYAANPELYETSLNLRERFAYDAPEEQKYQQCNGACLMAAENEARMRKAPLVTLDHMLMALLQEGTQTWDYLIEKGIDPRQWKLMLDIDLPRFEVGPRWPENAYDLTMNLPDRSHKVEFIKDPPEGVDADQLTREQLHEMISRKPTGRIYTDLTWLCAMAHEKEAAGYRLLTEAGITEDELKYEVEARELNDREWYLKKPNLVEQLQNVVPGRPLADLRAGQQIEEAALYEARLRCSPRIEFQHYLLALLIDGTDTSAFIDSLGIDRVKLVEDIEAITPRSERRIYYPDASLTQTLGFLFVSDKKRFSDLLVLQKAFTMAENDRIPFESITLEVLKTHGVTSQLVNQRLDAILDEPSEE